MRLSRILKKNPYARMPLQEAKAVVARYLPVADVEADVEKAQAPRNWFLPADCLPVEAPKIATAFIIVLADLRRRGESWPGAEILHGDLARFSYLPDLDRANYHFTHRSESNTHPLDEAAYIAAQDRYTQIRAKLTQDWHAAELDGDYVPLYDYLPKEISLPELSYIRALTRDYANVVCDREPIINRLREWLPAPKEMICRALAIEYVLLSERAEENLERYWGVARVLGHFVDEAGPGFYDTRDLSPHEEFERRDAIFAQDGLHMRITTRALCDDSSYWGHVFMLMADAYEIRLGIRPLIEPATPPTTPSVTHSGDK